jgi:hypothetical protein
VTAIRSLCIMGLNVGKRTRPVKGRAGAKDEAGPRGR